MNPTLPPFLQELFDRGIDPLEDAAARAWLEQHPDQLPAFASLRALLHEVREVPPAMTWRRWPFQAAAGAAAVLVGIGAWWPIAAAMRVSVPPPTAPPTTVMPRPLFAARSCVRSSATTERIAERTREFAFATVQGTVSRQASTTLSTTSTERQLPTVFLRTTLLEEVIRP